MPRNKRGGRGTRNGASKATPQGGSPNLATGMRATYYSTRALPGLCQTADTALHHLSLHDAARNTERNHFWNADLKLRYTQVNFISAGTSGSIIKQNENELIRDPKASDAKEDISGDAAYPPPNRSMANMSIDNKMEATVPRPPPKISDVTEECMPRLDELDCKWADDGSQIQKNDMFFVDTNGYSDAVETGLPHPSIYQSDSSSSSSSEEVIVFRGRVRSSQPDVSGSEVPASVIHNSISTASRAVKSSVIKDDPVIQLSANKFARDLFSLPKGQTCEAAKKPTRSSKTEQDRMAKASQRRVNSTQRRKSSRPANKEDDDKGIADYIANVQEHRELSQQPSLESWRQRDLHDEGPRFWQDETGSSGSEKEPAALISHGLSDYDIHISDELSTSSEILDEIDSILSKRERSSGFQYLVVWEGCATDDAKWVSRTSLDKAGAAEMITLFEATERLNQQLVAEDDETDSDSAEDDQAIHNMAEDMFDIEREEDELEIMKAHMTDGQIAIRLAKQEELGLGSAEVMLFDGEELKNWADKENLRKVREQALNSTELQIPKNGRARSAFVSASLFGDVLDQDLRNGYDVIDQDRLSLRKRPKRRRGILPFEISDSELEASMRLAWDNDRTKKKLQKQHREELRAQGLLGRRDRVDIKLKYAEGMSVGQMMNEVKGFLMSDRAR